MMLILANMDVGSCYILQHYLQKGVFVAQTVLSTTSSAMPLTIVCFLFNKPITVVCYLMMIMPVINFQLKSGGDGTCKSGMITVEAVISTQGQTTTAVYYGILDSSVH